MDKGLRDRLWAEVNAPAEYGFREWAEPADNVVALLEATNANEDGKAFCRTLSELERGGSTVRLHSGYVRELLEAV